MKAYAVNTSGILEAVMAENHQEAAIKAFKRHAEKSENGGIPIEDLGTLTEIAEESDSVDDRTYMLTSKILELAGFVATDIDS